MASQIGAKCFRKCERKHPYLGTKAFRKCMHKCVPGGYVTKYEKASWKRKKSKKRRR